MQIGIQYCLVLLTDLCLIVGFISYTEDIVDVIERHSVLPHIYADDTQLLASAKPEDSSRLRQQLSDCVADVTQWCSSRRLQLNADKTEAIWIGSRAAINQLSSQDRSLTVGMGGYYDQSLRRRARPWRSVRF